MVLRALLPRRRRPRQVWLHIGLPKCGSTTIQRHMAEAYEQHLQLGLCYPQSHRSATGYRNHIPLARLAAEDLPAALAEIEAEADRHGCRRILLSCEHWTNAFYTGRLAALAEALQQQMPDWQIRLVAYFRNPYDLAESSYAQFLRAGLFGIDKPAFFAAGPPGIGRYLSCFEENYGFPLPSLLGFAQMLQAGLPAGSLILRSNEPADLDAPDMLSDFCSLLSLPPPAAAERRNSRILPRKLAEIEYVQTRVSQPVYAQLRPKLLKRDFTRGAPPGPARGSSLHLSAAMAEEITRRLEAERGQLAALFATRTDALCAARRQDWSQAELLDEEARARLRKFIRRQSP
ncbi:hypothetical protein KUW17_20230 [Leisingera aquaemixtae]|uniref:hypothetical protein n=1 Tax=Leisingera aquaemixtae TaxID=1396826 RepID=UPI001C95D109|nr:hypothetical protein [Leisingera aquaemixtae]MBY6069082.1 hypothetical protein [Leisingera aquaemixtae]